MIGPRKYRINIGPVVRARRKELSLTLQTLADRSGLSIAFISQVERGKTTPSLMSLLQLSEALEVDMNYFVAATQEEKLFRRADEPEYIEVDSPIKYIRLSNSFPAQKLEPFIFILPPQHHSSAEKIGEGHEGEGFLYVLEGEVHGAYRGNKFVLNPGDTMHYDLSDSLALNNFSNGEAKILWVGSVVLFPVKKIQG
jgi:transcriptional regulator with XRE-family HTH domain